MQTKCDETDVKSWIRGLKKVENWKISPCKRLKPLRETEFTRLFTHGKNQVPRVKTAKINDRACMLVHFNAIECEKTEFVKSWIRGLNTVENYEISPCKRPNTALRPWAEKVCPAVPEIPRTPGSGYLPKVY